MANRSSCSPADALQAVRALVDDRRLTAYFHLELAERKGVHLRDVTDALALTRGVELSPRVVAAPAAAPPAAGWVEFLLERVKCEEQGIELDWRLPIEGLSGSATAALAGHQWVLKDLRTVER